MSEREHRLCKDEFVAMLDKQKDYVERLFHARDDNIHCLENTMKMYLAGATDGTTALVISMAMFDLLVARAYARHMNYWQAVDTIQHVFLQLGIDVIDYIDQVSWKLGKKVQEKVVERAAQRQFEALWDRLATPIKWEYPCEESIR